MTGPQVFPCEEKPLPPDPAGGADTGRWVLAATILGSSLAFIDGSVVNVALPAMQRSLGASIGGMQWVVNAYTLFLGALILVGGAAGDRFGRRRIFVGGIVVFTLASIACALAPGETSLIVARGVQGIGAAFLVPNSLALISASFSGRARGAAIGTWAGFAALTTAFGPVLGGWLVDAFDWRSIFAINVPLALLTVALTLAHVRESRLSSAGAPDWAGACLITFGLAALTYALIEGPRLGFGSLPIVSSLVGGVFLLAAFLLVEHRSAAPMMPLDLFRSRTFSVANLLTLLLYFALSGALFFLPFNLIQVQGNSAAAAGAALLPFTLVMGLLSRASGGLAERFGARPLMVVGPILAAAGFAWLGVTNAQGPYVSGVLPAMLLLGLGMALCVPALTTGVMSAAPDERAGAASGINNAVARMAGLFAVAGLGILALWSFDGGLAQGLARLDLPAGVREGVRNGPEFGTVILPSGVEPAVAAAVEAAAREASMRAFRLVTLLAAGCAFAAGLSGLLLSDETRSRRVSR